MWGLIVYALRDEFENPGKPSPFEDLPAEARAIAERLRGDLPLMNACILEAFKQGQILDWKIAGLERAQTGGALH